MFNSGQTLPFSSGFPACPLLPADDHCCRTLEHGGMHQGGTGSPCLIPPPSIHLNWSPAGCCLCQPSMSCKVPSRPRGSSQGPVLSINLYNPLRGRGEYGVSSQGLPQTPQPSSKCFCAPSLPSEATTGRTLTSNPSLATTWKGAKFSVLSDPKAHLGLHLHPPPLTWEEC